MSFFLPNDFTGQMRGYRGWCLYAPVLVCLYASVVVCLYALKFENFLPLCAEISRVRKKCYHV